MFLDGDRIRLCPPAGVYMMGESARGQGDKGMKIGSSMFSDYNDIIICTKFDVERTLSR